MRASSSSEVDDTTLDWRRAGKTGGWALSCLEGPSESWGGRGGEEEERVVTGVTHSVVHMA